MAIPAPTPLLTQSMTQHECEDHRARLAIEVEIILDGYWQASPSVLMKTAIIADWMDELEDWHIDQVRWALRRWRCDMPNKKPNPGHIVALLKASRGRVYARQERDQGVCAMFAINREPKRIAA